MMDTHRATMELLSTFDDAELRATAEACGVPGTARLRRPRLLETLAAALDALERACALFGLATGADVHFAAPTPPNGDRERRG